MMYPAPLMTLAILARGTRRIRLGTNMLLLPLHHPLRVAEEAAMVDACSAGRLVLGVSAGYARDEFDAFGVDPAERGRRMEEGLALIWAVWTRDPVTLSGAQCRLETYLLFPAPVQKPHPPSTPAAWSRQRFGGPRGWPTDMS
jgi:alkanesulfonate monooxygenase SsuD/methylene tetrahydromethanopterin reductase-like flavin-dependent oxidoreductase (luciferase family)